MKSSKQIRASAPKTSLELIQSRLRARRIRHRANDNIAGALSADDLDTIEAAAAARFETVLDALLIERDHNTRETAARVARMYVREVFRGRYLPAPKATEFPNVSKLTEPYTVGPIAVRSTCSHHFCPIEGQAWCCVAPGKRLIGLSKFARLTHWVLARPQIQEEAAMQLADLLERTIAPKGLVVVLSARHACMTWRGVMEPATVMTTPVFRGAFARNRSMRAEAMAQFRFAP